MTPREEGPSAAAEALALLQAEVRGMQAQLTKMEQWIFMLEVDATELEMRLGRQIEGTLS